MPRWSWPALLLIAACQARRPELALSAGHQEMEGVLTTHAAAENETLFGIAKQYGVPLQQLLDANELRGDETLKVGTVLFIPDVPGAQLPQGEGTAANKTAVGSAAENRGERAPAPLSRTVENAASSGTLDWPLTGVLYARFGKKGKEAHDGIDLAAPLGTPVRTAAPGFVAYAGEQSGYGNIVIVEHRSGLATIYAHNQDLRVKTGQEVKATQVVATVGESGKTSGPHLHFEVRKEGVPVDPLLF